MTTTNNFVDENKKMQKDINDDDIVDTFEDLKLYHFDKCENTSSKSVKELRGNIYDFADKLVCKTFPFVSEYTKDEWKKIERNEKNVEYFKAVEGTLVRLYIYNNKWHLSTHKKINAFDSYWGSNDSYGTMFIQALKYHFMNENEEKEMEVENESHIFDRFCEKLNPDHVYAFILTPNNDSRIVCEVFESPVFYVCGVFDKDGKYLGLIDENIDKLNLYTLEKVNNFDEIDNINHFEHPGLIMYKTNDDGSIDEIVKIITNDYAKLAKLRNNQSNIKYRYFELRNNQNSSLENYKMFADFLALYKNRDRDFKSFESDYLRLNELVFDEYRSRHVNKNFKMLGKHLHFILLQCHGHYKNTGIALTRNDVLTILDKQNARTILNLLRENKIE